MDSKQTLPKRKELRIKQHDYSSTGAYFVTICVKDKNRFFQRSPLPMKCCRTSFQLLSAFAIRKSAAIFFNAAIWSILCGIRKTTKRGQVIFLQIRHEGIIENIIQNAETQEARPSACFLRYCAALSATCFS